jgi:hypothetical protein
LFSKKQVYPNAGAGQIGGFGNNIEKIKYLFRIIKKVLTFIKIVANIY